MYILTAVLRRRNGASFSFLFLFSFLLSAFSRFILIFVVCPHFSIRLLLSAFFHPHPPSADIRSAFYRHPYDNTLLRVGQAKLSHQHDEGMSRSHNSSSAIWRIFLKIFVHGTKLSLRTKRDFHSLCRRCRLFHLVIFLKVASPKWCRP